MLGRAVPFLVALAILSGACGDHAAPEQHPQAPVSISPSPFPSTAGGTTSTSPSSAEPAFDPRHVLTEDLAWAALSRTRYLPMYRRPGRPDPSFAFDTRNTVGRRSPMLVDRAERRHGTLWLDVLLPIRPNGRTAWTTAEDVRLVPREDRVDVDLSRRVLRYYRNGTLVDRISVGVGTPSTPTPTGTFYLYIRVPQTNPAGPYGILALGLSGFSPVISDWPGGGRAAIHGTPYESNRGEAVSHGCVRVWNPDMRKLRSLPLGTPVIITQ